MHFFQWKLFDFKENFTDLCSLESNWQSGSIGSDNGLVPNGRQAIIWSNEGMFYWRIYTSLDLNELKLQCIPQCLVKLYLHSLPSQYWDGKGDWHHTLWNTRTHVSYIVNTRADDGFTRKGVRKSAAMILTLLSRNIPASAPEELHVIESLFHRSFRNGFQFNNRRAYLTQFLPPKWNTSRWNKVFAKQVVVTSL